MSLRHLLRSQRVLQQQRPWVRPAPFKQQLLKPASLRRPFHTTRPQQSPLIPLPAMIISALKTGKLVSLVSFSSKTSLTLLPHTLYNQKTRTYMKFLAGIPVIGLSLLVLVGLDQAPNTGRLRLIFLTEAEELERVQMEVDQIVDSQFGLVAPRDNEYVQWLQTIVDNISAVAIDDVRDPVRQYDPEQKKKFDVDVVCDASTLNAMCAGERILVYDLMVHYMGYDTNRMAVILSHEIAHSIQRHFVEQHGMASLMFMLGDMTRGVFWIATEWLGPYINQKINEVISTFITMETQTTYNRVLEKEADLVGLKLLAKAGYDPTIAIEVWEHMANLDKKDIKTNTTVVPSEPKKSFENLDLGVQEFLSQLLDSWFGSTHPPSEERIAYMRQHMDEAVELYQQALQVNGHPKEYIFENQVQQNASNDMNEGQEQGKQSKSWYKSLYGMFWGGSDPVETTTPAPAAALP